MHVLTAEGYTLRRPSSIGLAFSSYWTQELESSFAEIRSHGAQRKSGILNKGIFLICDIIDIRIGETYTAMCRCTRITASSAIGICNWIINDCYFNYFQIFYDLYIFKYEKVQEIFFWYNLIINIVFLIFSHFRIFFFFEIYFNINVFLSFIRKDVGLQNVQLLFNYSCNYYLVKIISYNDTRE